MYCRKCGALLAANTAFCSSCGTPVAASSATGSGAGVLKRPAILSLLAVLQFIGGAFWILAALFMIGVGITQFRQGNGEAAAIVVGAVVMGGIGAAQLVCGIGLWNLKPYGRILQIVFACLGLLGIPFGTIIAILILVYLNKPGVKILFSGRQASELSDEEWRHVGAVSAMSGVAVALIAIVLGILGIGMVGIIAAIAIPGLVRARMSGNEASAIGSLRAISSAQVSYSSTCSGGGYAVTLADLAKPPQGSSIGFVSPDLGTNGVMKSGYIVFLAKDAAAGVTDVGTAAATCNGSTNAPASSYFVSAEPVTPGTTGTRYFATDTRGTIFSSAVPIANPIVPSPTVIPIE